MTLKDYEEMILKGTTYSGVKTSGGKTISASSLMDDILPMVLKFKHGLSPQKKIQQNTTGSLLQLGIDELSNSSNSRIVSALRLKHRLENGWTLSGEIDQLFADHEAKELFIVDNKLTKKTKVDDVRKKGKDHQYAIQLASYKTLVEKETTLLQDQYKGYKVRLILFCFLKDGTDHKAERIPDYKIVEIKDYHDSSDIIRMAVEQSNKVQAYLDSGETPEQCSELFWSRSFKPARPLRCWKFCAVSEHCPYFNSDPTARKKKINKKAIDILK